MDGMLVDFEQIASELSYGEPQIPVVSNVTGGLAVGWRCVHPGTGSGTRTPCGFADGIRCLHERGVQDCLKLGRTGVLSALVADVIREQGTREHASDEAPVVALPVLRRGQSESVTMMRGLRELWVRGASVDWTHAFAGRGAKRVALPTYAFQRQRYWLARRPAPAGGQLRGPRVAWVTRCCATRLRRPRGPAGLSRGACRCRPTMARRPRRRGVALLPGTAFLEIALCVGSELGCAAVHELVLEAPADLAPERGAVELQVAVEEQDAAAGLRAIKVFSRLAPAHDGVPIEREWTRHVSGLIGQGADGSLGDWEHEAATLAPEAWPPRGGEELPIESLYERLAKRGFDYGPVFRGARAVWRVGEEIFAEVALTRCRRSLAGQFCAHPALMDAALHTPFDSFGGDAVAADKAWLPFVFRGIAVTGRAPGRCVSG